MSFCRVKVCGITRKDDALKAVDLGAHAIGFIFADSPRRITVEQASDITASLPPFITTVGVFVNPTVEELTNVARACSLTAVQLHGEEAPDMIARIAGPQIIKAIRVNDRSSLEGLDAYDVAAFLFDAYSEAARGGTGTTFQWSLLRDVPRTKPWILSGGLNPGNVQAAVEAVRPYAVDVSSGVEDTPGVKNHALLEEFFAALREAHLL